MGETTATVGGTRTPSNLNQTAIRAPTLERGIGWRRPIGRRRWACGAAVSAPRPHTNLSTPMPLIALYGGYTRSPEARAVSRRQDRC